MEGKGRNKRETAEGKREMLRRGGRRQIAGMERKRDKFIVFSRIFSNYDMLNKIDEFFFFKVYQVIS